MYTINYDNVNWQYPDAEIARQLNITREGVRQARKRLNIGKPNMFRVRLSSLERENKLIENFDSSMSANDVAQLLDVSRPNAYRIMKKCGLRKMDLVYREYQEN